VHGVVLAVKVLMPRLQLVDNTAVLSKIGLGTNKLTCPPASISFSTVNCIL
jgi:hypothetical protein